MRLAVVAGKFPALSETFVSRQISALRALGHEVDVFANRRGTLPDPNDPARAIAANLNLRPKRNLHGLLKAATLLAQPALAAALLNPVRFGSDALSLRLAFSAVPFLKRPAFDAVLAHFGPNAAVIAKLRDAGLPLGPLVTFFHGSDAATAKPGDFAHLFATGERFIAVSEALASHLRELGAPADRVHVVYNGIDLARFTPKPAANPASSDAAAPPLRLISIARLVAVKGLEHAIAAIASLPPSLRDHLRYDIIGDGPLSYALQTQINAAGLATTITLRGGRPHADLPALLQSAEVFLFPSLNEGLGIAAIEAMACGLPVIASRVGGIPEVVADESTGLLVPPANSAALAAAITRLASDPALRRRLGTAGRARAEALFNANAQLIRLLEIITLARTK